MRSEISSIDTYKNNEWNSSICAVELNLISLQHYFKRQTNDVTNQVI